MTRTTPFIRRTKKYFVLAVFTFLTCTLPAQTPAQDTTFKKIRFGGYGEMLYQHMDYGPDRYHPTKGAPSDSRAYISIPRAVFAFDYKFRHDIVFSTELEIEYGGTGSAMELEYAEAGEYEMEVEKGGEIELEQFHITKSFGHAFNIRLGHMIVPVGITNAHHEPIFFFGASRPEGEMAMLPCTWHETGLAILGRFDKAGLNYELMVVNGLDPNGFSSENWVGSGRQKIFEQAVMTGPAFAGRFEFDGIKNLRLSASGYIGNSAKNSSKPERMTGMKGTVSIGSVDAQYLSRNFAVRANFIYGNLSDSRAISKANTGFRKTAYPITDVAQGAMTYAVEAGYNIFSFFGSIKSKLMPFVRYEYYNTAEKIEDGGRQMPRYKRDLLTVGLNYCILSNLVLKADYGMRRIDSGNFNNENTFGIGLAYVGWFAKK
jgi:hypothetical protein